MVRLKDIFTTDADGYPKYNWNYIETIPEFAALKNAKQNPKWHGEGNAWDHTIAVCKRAVECARNNLLCNDELFTFFAACLFHDIGKGISSFEGKDGRWHSYGHEETGEKITRRLLWDEPNREDICALVRWHMEPLSVFTSKSPIDKIVYLSKRVPSLRLLYCLKWCDLNGSVFEDKDNWDNELRKLNLFKEYAITMACYIGKNTLDTRGRRLDEYLSSTRNDRKNIIVYLMVGLPGAGKDTYINDILSVRVYKDEFVVLSRDDIRAELGLCKPGDKIVASKEDEERVSNVFNERLLWAAKNGKKIIINGINLKRKYRDEFKKLLTNYYVKWIYVYVEADKLSTNIERRKGQISEDIFIDMISKFDWPDYDEYDNILTVLT